MYNGSDDLKCFNATCISQSRCQSRCAAFLANIDEHRDATVHFLGQAYTLPPWSVSILPDCRNVVFNSAKVRCSTVLLKI